MSYPSCSCCAATNTIGEPGMRCESGAIEIFRPDRQCDAGTVGGRSAIPVKLVILHPASSASVEIENGNTEIRLE